MPDLHTFYSGPVWHWLTRLGEAEVLLPVALLTAAALFIRADQRRLAGSWMLMLLVAATLTTASKVAFIGWGLGCAAINFTGISGHTMFSTAIYPVLLVTLAGGSAPRGRRVALLAGCVLALLIGWSRIAVGAHSWSEVVAGWLVGAAVTAWVLRLVKTHSIALRPLLPIVLLAWLALTSVSMPASQTHSMVTRLALQMSGHPLPFTRSHMLRSAGQAPG